MQPPLAQVQQTIIAFVNAATWSQMKQFVEMNKAILFTTVANQQLDHLIKQYQHDKNIVLAIEERRAVLADCRLQGIEAAFADKLRLDALLAELNKPANPQNMSRMIDLCNEALTLIKRDKNPDLWANIQLLLGNKLLSNPHGDRAQQLEYAIAAYQEVLTIRTRQTDPKGWADTMYNLGIVYRDRIYGERSDNLEKSIESYQKALLVKTRETMPIQWAQTMHNIGLAFTDRIKGHKKDNLEEAIKAFEQALQVTNRQNMPTDWSKLMSNLATTYHIRLQDGRAKNLETAINYHKQTLLVRTRQNSPRDWALTMHNLGLVYSDRIHGDQSKNLEEAIAYFEKALEVHTQHSMPFEWAMTISHLAVVYRIRIQGIRADNIEKAITLFHKALEVQTQHNLPIRWAETVNNLANAYVHRIRGDRAENLELAITNYQNALLVRTPQTMPILWAKTMNNLAAAFKQRINGNSNDNDEKAIEIYEQILGVMTQEDMPVEWSQTMNNLGAVYSGYLGGNKAENMEKALKYFEGALKVRSPKNLPRQWAETMHNLGYCYVNRVHGDKAQNIEKAISIYQELLRLRTEEVAPILWADTQENLGNAYAQRVRGKRIDNVMQAVSAFEQALQVKKLETHPYGHLHIQRNLGYLYFIEGNWQEANNAYLAAIRCEKILRNAAYTEIGRQQEVTETAQVYVRSAYCLCQMGQTTNALRQLEQGKTRLLTEALALDEAELSNVSEATKQALYQVRQQVHELEAEMRLSLDTPARRDDRVLADLLHQARAELNEIIETIRTDYPEFMPADLEITDTLALIPSDGVLVAPLITSQGGTAFVIPHGTKDVTTDHILNLPTFTSDYLANLLQGSGDVSSLGGWLSAYGQFLRFRSKSTIDNWFQQISTTTSKLWDSLMGPIHEQLQTLNLSPGATVLLMPQGGLGLLPLHAAWRLANSQPRYFCDDYTITYAPSAYALHISRQRAAQPERQARSLFAAINPTRDLTYTPLEGEAIAQLFPSAKQTILQEANATTTAFPTAAKGHTYIHYSGHGSYNWRDPLQSGLRLADKTYTLSDILSDMDLGTCRLVTLSACETGITEFQQSPDEYVGLPAGFLQAGATAVISTLWAVNDLSTMLLMEKFYQLHLQNGLDFASALRQAQLWLRNVTAKELADRFGEERMKLKGSRLTLAEASDYWRRFAADEPDSKPFEHPYYWAAFTFTGA